MNYAFWTNVIAFFFSDTVGFGLLLALGSHLVLMDSTGSTRLPPMAGERRRIDDGRFTNDVFLVLVPPVWLWFNWRHRFQS